ncbi:solute carrier family 22 member 14 isoform X2 [Peromyscus eremicus]|uniref:solute carrier family 22 member 14 isoform X2 n=1 Tax=Peromyscus eremicus TaxID=42410 RepID=UPI0027DB5A9F|nr:solute carrier family 22 member 14 isoform X2 [Peromyscus eremicus]
MEEKQNSKPASGPQSPRSTQQHEISFPSHSWSLEMLFRRLKALDARREDKLTSVMDTLGEFGTFQWRLVALTFIPSMLSSFFMLSDHFMVTAQRPYCNTSWILAVGPNLSVADQLNLTLPRAPNGSFLTCLMYIPVSWDLDSIIHFGLNYTETCKYGWIYPYADKRSLINEFDLVCGNEPKKESMQTVFLAGILTGSLLFGFLSDKMGRYPTILMSLLGLLIFGFGTAFVNSFYQYLFFRFVVALAAVGYAISSVSLVMEWLVGEHRAHAVILEHCFIAVGVLFLSGAAYKIFHWRLLFLLGGMPMFPLISNIWFTVSYIYFTLSLKMKDLGVDIYFRQVIPGIVEVPARLCCIVLLEHLGRKCSLFLSLILVAIMCLFLLFLPQELKTTIVVMLVLGEFSLAATVTIFLVYTAELLPTVLRSTGLGMVSLALTGGAVTALTVFNQIKTQLPIFFCCLSCVVALCFSSLVPETGNKPLNDGIEYSTRESIDFKRRSQEIAAMIIAGESMSDVVIDEVTKNTILNAMPLQSEVDMFFNTASEKPSTSEIPSPAP